MLSLRSYFFKQTFMAVLDVQKNCKDNTESFHVCYTRFPILLTSYINVVYLLQL